MISDNPESLIDFIRTLDLELEDEDYLWPGTLVSKLLIIYEKRLAGIILIIQIIFRLHITALK